MNEPNRREPEFRPHDPVRGEIREERYVDHGAPAAYSAPLIVDRYNYRAVQVTWFLIALIDVLIGLRFVLKLLGASSQSAFVGFLYGVTGPLVAPFNGIFPTTGSGFYIFEPAALIAMAIYALIGWGIVALIRILTSPKRDRPVY